MRALTVIAITVALWSLIIAAGILIFHLLERQPDTLSAEGRFASPRELSIIYPLPSFPDRKN